MAIVTWKIHKNCLVLTYLFEFRKRSRIYVGVPKMYFKVKNESLNRSSVRKIKIGNWNVEGGRKPIHLRHIFFFV